MNLFFSSTEYEITGRNFPLLLSKLNLKKIPFENLYYSKNGLRITIDKKDQTQFTKLVSQSWKYKVISKKGWGAKLNYALKKIGVIIGAILFIVGAYFSDNILLKVRYGGDYSYFQKEINEVLERNGIKKFTHFSSIDYKDLSEQLYAENPLICYSLVKKEGNSLVIEVKKSQHFSGGVNANLKEIKATASGVILDLKVYRGVALKKIGDQVEKGEVIVSGERIEEDKVFSNFVLATVSILKTYEYAETGENSPDNLARVTAKAKALCGAEEYYSVNTTCENNKILVKLKYIIVLGG